MARRRGRERRRSLVDIDTDEAIAAQAQHSFDHRGQTGKYANIYVEDVPLWKPNEGDHEICIVPYFIEENSVFRFKGSKFNRPFDDDLFDKFGGVVPVYKLTVLIHYGVGVNEDAVVCLRTIGEKCPICEFRETTDDEDIADRLYVSKRAIYNIFCFDSDKEMSAGVQIWEAPHASIEDVLSELYKDRRTGEIRNFMDPKKGWNVLFERKGTGLKTEYRRLEIVERRKEDDFTDGELEELYESAYNLEEVIEVKEYDELKEMLHGTKARDDEQDEEEDRGRGRRRSRRDTSRRSLRDRSDREADRGSRFRGRARDVDSSEDDDDDRRPSRGRRSSGRQRRGSADDDSDDRRSSRRRKTTSSKGRRSREKRNDAAADRPKCFGIDHEAIPECEDCPQELWEACMKEYEANN